MFRYYNNYNRDLIKKYFCVKLFIIRQIISTKLIYLSNICKLYIIIKFLKIQNMTMDFRNFSLVAY